MGGAARCHRSGKNAAHAARQYHHRWRDRCAIRRGGRDQSISRLRSRVLSCSRPRRSGRVARSEEHTSELQSLRHLVCRLLLEKKKKKKKKKEHDTPKRTIVTHNLDINIYYT